MQVPIDNHELRRLSQCEHAWLAVCHALQAGNADTFRGPGTGIECAVREVERLQKAAAAQFQAAQVVATL